MEEKKLSLEERVCKEFADKHRGVKYEDLLAMYYCLKMDDRLADKVTDNLVDSYNKTVHSIRILQNYIQRFEATDVKRNRVERCISVLEKAVFDLGYARDALREELRH